MGDTVNYWKIGKEHIINHNNMNYIYSFIGYVTTIEIHDKAKELYEKYKNEYEGILFRVIRTDKSSNPINCYYIYYNGNKFIRNPDFIIFDTKDIDEYLRSILKK